jgi:hypothetical protein
VLRSPWAWAAVEAAGRRRKMVQKEGERRKKTRAPLSLLARVKDEDRAGLALGQVGTADPTAVGRSPVPCHPIYDLLLS